MLASDGSRDHDRLEETTMRWARRLFMEPGLAGLGAALASRPGAAQPQEQRAAGAAPIGPPKVAVLCSRGERWAKPVNGAAWAILGRGGSALDAVVAGANV